MPVQVRRPKTLTESLTGWGKLGITPGYLLDKAFRDAHFDIVAAAGVRWIRVDANWGQIHTSSGVFNWAVSGASMDAQMAAVAARGLEPLVVVLLDTVPAWTNASAGSNKPPTLANYPEFANFLIAFKTRYPWVRAFQIGNEVNLPVNWGGTIAQYTQMLRAAYPALKQLDADTHIISSGMSPADSSAGTITEGTSTLNDVEWMHRFYWTSGGGYCDGIGVHPYSQPAIPPSQYLEGTVTGQQTWPAWPRMVGGWSVGDGVQTNALGMVGTAAVERNTKGQTTGDLATISTIPEVMSVHGDGQKKLWITEFGAHTGTSGVTQADQIKHVRGVIAETLRNPQIACMFWYSAKDLGSDGATSNSWGLYTSAGVAKSAFAVFQQLVAKAAR